MTTDCLIIGHNDSQFDAFVSQLKSMGVESGNFRELDLSYIEIDGQPHHSMSVLNHFYNEGRPTSEWFHHADFVWAVITNLATKLTSRGLSFDYVKLFQPCKEELKNKLMNDDVLTVAITTTLVVSPEPVREIVEFVRRYNSRVKIVVGGPYIFNQSKVSDEESLKYLFRHLGADVYVISNEGESSLVLLLRALKNGESLAEVPNLAIRTGDQVELTKRVSEDNSLEENMVDYSLFSASEIGRFVSLRTAKSCPYACAFCGHPEIAGKYRYLDIAHVERELDRIKELGSVEALDFVDDTFNVPKARFKDMCRLMIRKNYGFHWISYFRSDQADEEAIELAAEAGCRGVFLGIESGSDTVLECMNKTARTKHYRKAIPLLRKAGIVTHTNMLIGFPGETERTVQETIDFIQEAQPDFYRVQLWYCDPTTPVWRKREELGIQGAAYNWTHHTMSASQACDLRDRMFMSIDRSTWLPDYAFEVFCVLYLRRKGMSLEQVKTYLACFNNVVRDGLVDPRSKIHSTADLIAQLRAAAQFDRPSEIQHTADHRTGQVYREAERFWIDRFGRGEDQRCGTAVPALDASEALGNRRVVEGGFHDASDAGQAALLRAVTALGLVECHEQSAASAALLVCLGGESVVPPVVPLAVSAGSELTFDQLVAACAHDYQLAEPNAWAARMALTRPGIIGLHGVKPPELDLGVWVHERGRTLDELAARANFAFGRRPARVLHVIREANGLSFAIEYDASVVTAAAATSLGAGLTALLRAAGRTPNLLARDLLAHKRGEAAAPALGAVGTFQF
jgi:anaerobic magnesium-protoporphyrin IX monomethyl ester cyclase